MTSKHTPGPWAIYPESNGTLLAAVDYTPGLPIRALVADVYMKHPNAIANARLIAAAPELLSALNALTSTIEWGFADELHKEHPEFLAALAAIAKAEGRS